MTLKQVGQACEMHHGQLSKIEHGHFRFLNLKMQKICTVIGIDPDAADGASADDLHARLDRLIHERPGAAAALRAVFEAFDQMAN